MTVVGWEEATRVERSSEATRERLTRARIYHAALSVIDRQGIGSLSMRSLAKELGVKAGSLYYHFDGKAELLDGLADSLYARLGASVAEDKSWTDNLRAVFLGLQKLVDEHPKVAPLLLRRLVGSPAAVQQARVLLRTVSDVEMDPETSAMLVRNLVALLLGHSLMLTWQDDDAANTSAEVKRPATSGADRASEGGDILSNGSLEALTRGLETLIRGFGMTRSETPSDMNEGFVQR